MTYLKIKLVFLVLPVYTKIILYKIQGAGVVGI